MKNNFIVQSGIYLIQGDYELDLHNNYEFQRFSYDINTKVLKLVWARSDEEWAPKTDPKLIQIECSEVTSLKYLPRDSSLPFTEDSCLSEIGYWTEEEWCEGVFTTDSEPEENWYTAFDFMSGATILVKAEKATAIITR